MMNLKTFILLASLLISGTMLLEGCLDAPVIPKGNITGTVYDGKGFPEKESLVSYGDYPIAVSDNNGNFSIDALTTPYDLVVGRYYGIKYLKLNKPISELYNFEYESASNSMPIEIAIPSRDVGKLTFIKFFSENNFYQEKDRLYPYDTISAGLDTIFKTSIDLPFNKRSISGKILYLEAVIYPYENHIYSYTRYGIKDVTLSIYNLNMRFNPEDIRNITDNLNLDYNVIYPDNNFRNIYTGCYFSIPGMNIRSDLALEQIDHQQSGRFISPAR